MANIEDCNSCVELRSYIDVLTQKLEDSRNTVLSTEDKLNRMQKLFEMANKYAEELKIEVLKLNEEIRELIKNKNKGACTSDIAVQTDWKNILSDFNTESLITGSSHQTATKTALESGDRTSQHHETEECTSKGNTIADVKREPANSREIDSAWKTSTTLDEPEEGEIEQEEPQSITESLREAAEAAQRQTEFVFDEGTGLYYDKSSGYYYDAERSLYYEPYSGMYYKYNTESNSYEYHSRVDFSQYTEEAYTRYYENVIGGKVSKKKRKDKKGRHKRTKEAVRKERKRKKEEHSCDKHMKNKEKKAKLTPDKDDSKVTGMQKIRKEHYLVIDKTDGCIDMKEVHHENLERSTNMTNTSQGLKDKDKEVESDHSAADFSDCFDQRDAASHDKAKDWCDENTGSEHQIQASMGKPTSGIDSAEHEEGEMISSSSSDSEYFQSSDSETDSSSSEASTSSEDTSPLSYPPSLRLIVTNSGCLDVGTLYVVPYTGATIGRETSLNHLVLIPDTDISKLHCSIQYNNTEKMYEIINHSTKTGTLINGRRLSQPPDHCEPTVVRNLDQLHLGNTTFELHIHPGNRTCDDCEPGLIQAKLQQSNTNLVQAGSDQSVDKETKRRREMKKIRKRYGLADAPYVDKGNGFKCGYQDRSEVRRRTKGSDNPHQPDDPPSSVNRAISQENKGHKLLAKLGWKEGQSLGKSQTGIKEPIQAAIRSNQAAGLGSICTSHHSLDDVRNVKSGERWAKARKRYNQLEREKDPTQEVASSSVQDEKSSQNANKVTFVQGKTETFVSKTEDTDH